MATTTNFGWETPDDTDLVKDGAAAIRTVANSIDTSFVDLKGGTTGQILSKASNTDLDYAWITNDVGDITAVTAGTGITGGGSSGAVTITNDMATKIDAKGDLIVGTGADTYDRLAVGTDGQVLQADSTAATGLKWAASTPTFTGCVLSKASQNLANSTATTLSWNNEIIDTNGFHDNVTNNSRITIPANYSGKYLCSIILHWEGNAAGYRQLNVFKNGALITTNTQRMRPVWPQSADQSYIQYTMIFDLIATDYIEIQGVQNSGGSLDVYGGATSSNWAMIYLGA